MLGAVFAAMAMQWTVARAVSYGMLTEQPAVHAHRQGRRDPQGPDFPAFWKA